MADNGTHQPEALVPMPLPSLARNIETSGQRHIADSLTDSKGQFAGGKVDPVEAGRKGGKASGGDGDGASQQQGSDYKPTGKPNPS
jgi:hypothetical protein